MPEFTEPVFGKTSPKRSFSMTENERFRLVFTKTGSINSGTGICWEIHRVGKGERYFVRPRPFLQQASGYIFNDDVNGFSSISDICLIHLIF